MEDIVPSTSANQTSDAVAMIVAQWREIAPELDPSPLLIIGRLHRVAALTDARLRPPFAAAGLANGDFDLLAALRRQPPPHELHPAQLAVAMMVTTGATTKRIDRLEAQHLVTRRTCDDDGRSRLIALTHRGRALVDELIRVHLDNEAALVCELTVEQRIRLAELLAKMLSFLEGTPLAAHDHRGKRSTTS
jgi:DNA-binding MarR family transcriptional regulator